MTRAVCLGCGAFKVGAWTPCRACGHTPETPEDQARHVLVSDQVLDGPALEAVAERVARGEPVELDEEEVEDWARTIAANPTPPIWFALLVVGVPVLLIATLLLLSVWLLAV